MPQERSPSEDPVDALLGLLATPERARALTLADWDAIVRVARAARVLGQLRVRLDRAGVLAAVPDQVRLHLDSDHTLVRHRRQMVQWELECIARALAGFAAPLVLLKGAAYVAQGFAFAEGRLPSDVDLMVPRASLDAAERALVAAGWQMEPLDAYDERYYREWSHELPPMRYPEHPLELDLHHTILPLTGRARPDAAALFERAMPVAGTAFRVLCPTDQLLHACSQLFQDSDCAGRLRDLVDIDALIGELGATERFWAQVIERARVHGLERSLAHALRYAERFLGTRVPEELRSVSSPREPNLSSSPPPDNPTRGQGSRGSRSALHTHGLDSRFRGNDGSRGDNGLRGNDELAHRARLRGNDEHRSLARIPRVARFLMDRLVPLALLPTHPDRTPPLTVRGARFALFLRSHWLRMPPWLLARHALTKAWRNARTRTSPEVE